MMNTPRAQRVPGLLCGLGQDAKSKLSEAKVLFRVATVSRGLVSCTAAGPAHGCHEGTIHYLRGQRFHSRGAKVSF